MVALLFGYFLNGVHITLFYQIGFEARNIVMLFSSNEDF
jgi:hypothetical protein